MTSKSRSRNFQKMVKSENIVLPKFSSQEAFLRCTFPFWAKADIIISFLVFLWGFSFFLQAGKTLLTPQTLFYFLSFLPLFGGIASDSGFLSNVCLFYSSPRWESIWGMWMACLHLAFRSCLFTKANWSFYYLPPLCFCSLKVFAFIRLYLFMLFTFHRWFYFVSW